MWIREGLNLFLLLSPNLFQPPMMAVTTLLHTLHSTQSTDFADKRWMSQLYSTQSTDFAGQENAVKMSEIVYHSWEPNHYNKQNEPHE
jgi:hypothetical protein